MKIKDIRTKSDKELTGLITTLSEQIASAYVTMRTTREPNVKHIHGLKKSLARAKTIEREREIKAELETQS